MMKVMSMALMFHLHCGQSFILEEHDAQTLCPFGQITKGFLAPPVNCSKQTSQLRLEAIISSHCHPSLSLSLPMMLLCPNSLTALLPLSQHFLCLACHYYPLKI